jgi:hypothetical protein
MVNLRYHIVSLTAVFLALGLGILAGTTVIDQQVVSGLKANTAALRNDLDREKGRVSQLDRQLDVWNRFGTVIEPALVEGLLAGRGVVILSDQRVPGVVISGLTEALTFANAKPPTRLTFTAKWVLDSPTLVQQLALASRSKETQADDVVTEAAEKLGARLGGSANPRADGDLIKTLTEADFLDVHDLPGSGSFPAANALVIVISSGAQQEIPALNDFYMPMLRTLSGARIVAVTELFASQGGRSLAELVRGDRDMARSVCTIDHVDTVAGHLSVVYALRALAAGDPAAHYGVRDGATAVAPNVRPA